MVSGQALSCEQAELADVAVGERLDARDGLHARGAAPNRWAKRFCGRRYSSTGSGWRIFETLGHFAVLGLEHREQPGLLGEPRDADGVVRAVPQPSGQGTRIWM